MSTDSNNEEADDEMMSRCASCGIAGGDHVKLKRCNGCYLVRYCGVKCQKGHRKKHKKECRKRAAELHDELLFKQPESTHFGDCPICCLPLSLDQSKSTLYPCCRKVICGGCNRTNQIWTEERREQHTCPFCRNPRPELKEVERILMKRVEANDLVALREVGTLRNRRGDYKGAFEFWTKAAELGDALAHFQLFCLCYGGKLGDSWGVEKNEKRGVYHLEQAAIGGHAGARYNLGCLEWRNGQYGGQQDISLSPPTLEMINHWNKSRNCINVEL